MNQPNKNLDTTGTYFEGLSDFEPTPEDKAAYLRSLEAERKASFSSHPAFQWATQHTNLSRTDRETFTVYSNSYRDPSTGLFSLPMGSIYSQFLQFGMET